MDVDNDLTLHQEVDEFLKLIKRSDYKVVDQIYQTPSKIFVISLLLNSEAHKGALMKVLMQVHVVQRITMDQFNGIVSNITACYILRFHDRSKE